MNNIKILVTSANGHTGLPAAKELLKLGFNVRAMVRNINGNGANELRKLGAEIFRGDLEDARDVEKALNGIQRAYFCAPFDRNVTQKTALFVTTAENIGLEHVVYMTQWLATPEHFSPHTKEQWLSDQIIKLHQKVKYTFINPGLFGFTYFLSLESVIHLGILPTPIKNAINKSIGLNAPPSEEDQGKVIAHILQNPEKHHQMVYRPTGPKLISQQDVALTFEKVLGRKVKLMEVSEKMLMKSLKSMGYPQYQYANVRYYMKELAMDTFAVGGPTNVVKDITGKEPDDFETIVRREITKRTDLKPGFFNKIKAIKNFLKILTTKTPDIEYYERAQNFPKFLNGMKYTFESDLWPITHK